MLGRWQKMISFNSYSKFHTFHMYYTITDKYASPSPLPDNITIERSLFCLFVFFLLRCFACILHVHVFVCMSVVHYSILNTYFFICAWCAQPYSHTHACRCVSSFVCLYCMCMSVYIYTYCMCTCHFSEKGGVSIFPSPFFGDNDDHFFFSVTDVRQN